MCDQAIGDEPPAFITSPDTPVTIIKGSTDILLIAPHACIRDGEPEDDENTGPITEAVARQIGCSAIINTYFHKPDDKEYPHGLEYGNLNLYLIDDAKPELVPGYLDAIRDVVGKPGRAGKTTVIWIHGADDTKAKVVAGKGTYPYPPDKIDAFIGYGQGDEPKTKAEGSRETADFATVERFRDALISNGMNAVLTDENATNYRGRKETLMNQWFLNEGYTKDQVESIQLEIRKEGFRDLHHNIEKTAGILIEALSREGLGRCIQKEQLPSQADSYFGDLRAKYRTEQSFFGYNPHVLKSGIQKYGRRSEIEKGLWCLVEMDLFSLLDWDGLTLEAYLKAYPEESRDNVKQSARRLRTNMFNRLVVMMSEELSVSAWWLPMKMRELYKNWTENRDTLISRKYLVDTYKYLTSQRMIRLISDLKSVYLIPPDYVKPKQMDDLRQIHDGIQTLYPAIFSNQAKVGDTDWDLNEVSEDLQSYIKGVIYNLEKGSDHVFYWISRLCDFRKKDGKPDYRHLELVWVVLYRFIDRDDKYKFVRESISALEFFFNKMTHNEKPIYLYHAVLLLVRRDEIDWNSSDPGIDTPIDDVEKLYRNHLAGGKIRMDGYILDLHTHAGKRSADCLANFASEGAFIKNENKGFLRREYREIYIKLKHELDSYRNNGPEFKQKELSLTELSSQVNVPIEVLSTETMDQIKDAPRAQLITAKYKKPVFILGNRIYKGPFACDDNKLIDSLRFTYAIQQLEEALNLPEWQRGSLPWNRIACWEENQYYLEGSNVGKTKDIPSEIVSSKIETNVKVVPRGGCVKLVFDVEKNGRLTDEIKIAALQHLYFRFLLGVGDSGTHNVLIRDDYKTTGRLIAGIDIEENRGSNEKDSRLAHLFKSKPSKAQVALYGSLVGEIKTLCHHDLNQDPLAKLDAVGIALESVKKNLEIWESLKPVASADEKLKALPHSLTSKTDANADLANEAFEKLKAIFLEHHDAMIKAGQYIIDTFYGGNARLALAKNKSKDKPPSLNLLIEKLKEAPEKDQSGNAPSVSWFYKAVNLAAHEAICKQKGLSTFTILGHSHKLQLLNVPKLKQINGNKFDEAIESAFQEKERLARYAHEEKLTVRGFKDYIDEEYPSNNVDLVALPPADKLQLLGKKKLNELREKAEKKIEAGKKLVADYTEAFNKLKAVLSEMKKDEALLAKSTPTGPIPAELN